MACKKSKNAVTKKAVITAILLLALGLGFIRVAYAENSIIINPSEYSISGFGYNKSFSFIVSAINSDARPYSILIKPSKGSLAYAEFISIKPKEFNIDALSTKNIEIGLFFDRQMPAGKNIITLEFVSAGITIGKLKISFYVNAEKKDSLIAKSFNVKPGTHNEPVILNFWLYNNGTTLLEPNITVDFMHNKKIIDSYKAKAGFGLFPGREMNFSLLYDPAKLKEFSSYKAIAKISYGNKKITAESSEFSFDKSPEIIKHIKKGDVLELNLSLKGRKDELSFYKVSYSIKNSFVSGKEEGKIYGSKNISLKIDCSKLGPGSYELKLIILSGKKLENKEEKKIALIVEETKEDKLRFAAMAFAVIIALYFIVKGIALKKAKRKNKDLSRNQEIKEPIWAKANPFEKAKIYMLRRELRIIEKRYNKLEKECSRLTAEISGFIEDSNSWLKRNVGESYGFS